MRGDAADAGADPLRGGVERGDHDGQLGPLAGGRRAPAMRSAGVGDGAAGAVTTARPRSASASASAPTTSWPARSGMPASRRSVVRAANDQAATGFWPGAFAVALTASPTDGSSSEAASGASHPGAGTAAVPEEDCDVGRGVLEAAGGRGGEPGAALGA